MANVVALIPDDRVRAQVETLLGELPVNDLRTGFFSSLDDFERSYLKSAAPAADGATDPRVFAEVHLFLFALDAVDPKHSGAFIDRVRSTFKTQGRVPADGQRLVLLKWEDDGVSKLDVLHPALDDLIYLPIDRLTFLQKLEIFLGLPKRVKPSFLFSQEIAAPIEISKISRLERLSDVALAIRNPVALRRGLPGHFYLLLPGEKTPVEIKGKVLRSEPHPEHPEQFLVYFAYFGMPKATLALIRRALQKDSHYKSLLVDDHQRFRFDPSDVWLSPEECHRSGVVVLDRDHQEAQKLGEALSKGMDRLVVQTESSYALFLHRYLDREAGAFEANMPDPTTPDRFFASAVNLVVNAGSKRILEVAPATKPDAQLLGYPAADLATDPTVYGRLFTDRGTLALLGEAATLVAGGTTITQVVAVNDAAGLRVAVTVTLGRSSVDGAVTVGLAPADLNQIADQALRQKKHENLEALVVEAAVVPADPAAWVSGLRQAALDCGLNKPGRELQFWVVTDQDDTPEALLNTPEIHGLLRRPVDHRELLFSFSENLNNKNTVYHFANLGWTHPGLNLHVSKPIDLESVSEFGATLRAPHRLAPGTIFYLRKSIFDNAPNQCLAARVYACEPHPTEKDLFQVFVTYWGINDAFLKFARTWIRENYAHQKQGAG